MRTKSLSQCSKYTTLCCLYLTKQQVSDVENHAEGELGRKEGEEPLGGIHVCLQVQLLEMGPQVWELFLWEQNEKRKDNESTLCDKTALTAKLSQDAVPLMVSTFNFNDKTMTFRSEIKHNLTYYKSQI